MPYPRVEPVDESDMRKKRYRGHFTICETLREIYMMSDNETIKLKCRLAVAMAKRMQEKLKEYKLLTSKESKNDIRI